MPQDYSKTLNLPRTDFPMKAGLPQREPKQLEKWNKEGLNKAILKKNEGKPLYILHDGPPYANGNIHLGTAMNKILKDFIVRSHNMLGYLSPYVPGWDTHGLPIENKVIDKYGIKSRNASPVEFRRYCHDFALRHIEIMTEQFKRLGVLGDWENPYRTLNPEFEARQIEVFGEMALKGYIYKGLKPVYWCPHDETALAEAEIEYSEDPCDSIYVKFAVKDDKGKLFSLGAVPGKTYFIIWTTTTWTLPGNMAVCLGPDFDYDLLRAPNGEYYIVAKALEEETMRAGGVEQYDVVATLKGSDFEYMTARHPFMPRDSLVIVGDHVTLESGTGCVHTAPGFGVDDFNVCRSKYPEIEIVVPVDSKGRLTKEAAPFDGLTTGEANAPIAEHLKKTGALFALKKIVHQYPHCWRCKKPIIFRATEQWFCSVDDIKKKTFEAIKKVKWVPGWGEERMTGMVRDRSDWCISRQRLWGVPIPIFYCKKCGKELITRESIDAVAALFRKEGSDGWYRHEAGEILPAGTKCACGCEEFTKDTDIMDVWFDSGCTHAAVLMERPELRWPADLYLEGNDQHRGWFQSSLLTSVAWKGEAPYKAVLTCGMVVDGEGRKMSKSLGNGISPDEVVNQYGADILRLWVASSDYQSDIRISKEILRQLSEVYRKIRNTARFILSNTGDFDPNRDAVPYEQLLPIDRWALSRLDDLVAKSREAYEAFEFHTIFHAAHNFCVVDLSNFYFDVVKDRLYVEKAESLTRRAAQTVLFEIIDAMTRLLSPILCYTAEEIWSYMPHRAGDDPASVSFNEIPKPSARKADEAFLARWNRFHTVRDDVKKALEEARVAKTIGSSLDAKVTLHCEGELFSFLHEAQNELATLFIVSQVSVEEGGAGAFKGDVEGLSVDVAHAAGQKCERCWTYSGTVGNDPAHPTLCARCAAIESAE